MLNTQLLSTIPYLNIEKQTCIWLNIIYSVDLNNRRSVHKVTHV